MTVTGEPLLREDRVGQEVADNKEEDEKHQANPQQSGHINAARSLLSYWISGLSCCGQLHRNILYGLTDNGRFRRGQASIRIWTVDGIACAHHSWLGYRPGNAEFPRAGRSCGRELMDTHKFFNPARSEEHTSELQS